MDKGYKRCAWDEWETVGGPARGVKTAKRRIAESLECVFIYGIGPQTSLEDIVRNRAEKVAVNRLAWADHTMSLEGQGLEPEENRKVLIDMIEELVETLPANMWDD